MAGALTFKNSIDAQAKGQIFLLLAGVTLPLFLTLLVIESYWIPLVLLAG